MIPFLHHSIWSHSRSSSPSSIESWSGSATKHRVTHCQQPSIVGRPSKDGNVLSTCMTWRTNWQKLDWLIHRRHNFKQEWPNDKMPQVLPHRCLKLKWCISAALKLHVATLAQDIAWVNIISHGIMQKKNGTSLWYRLWPRPKVASSEKFRTARKPPKHFTRWILAVVAAVGLAVEALAPLAGGGCTPFPWPCPANPDNNRKKTKFTTKNQHRVSCPCTVCLNFPWIILKCKPIIYSLAIKNYSLAIKVLALQLRS